MIVHQHIFFELLYIFHLYLNIHHNITILVLVFGEECIALIMLLLTAL